MTWYLAKIPRGDVVGFTIEGGRVTDTGLALDDWIGATQKEMEAKAKREGWEVKRIKA